MKMKRRCCFHCVIALMLLMTSCSGAQMQKGGRNGMTTNEMMQSNSGTVSYDISQWIPYEGEIASIENVDLLPSIKMENKDNLFYYNAIAYNELELPEDMYEMPTTSGWRIQLNELSPMGIIESGGIVLMPNCANSPVLCIYYESSDNLQCFLKSDFGENGICSLELDDFDIYADGCFVPKDERIEFIWTMHTGDEAYQKGHLPLDGDWKYYSLRLVYRECPTLQYEMNFALIEGYLYIDNLVSGEMKCIPADQIIRPEHEDM